MCMIMTWHDHDDGSCCGVDSGGNDDEVDDHYDVADDVFVGKRATPIPVPHLLR